METPEWLTSELVQKFLGDSEELQSFRVESATKPGDNFLSIIYCVKVKTTTAGTDNAEKSFILKTAIPMEELEAFEAFPKETLAYMDYIPKFEQFWLEYAGEDISFGPKCYYAAGKPLTIIVMEDLRAAGYAIRDRKKGLNSREMRMLLKRAAKYHACSVKYFEEIGPFDPNFDEGVARTVLRPAFELYYGALFEQFIWGVDKFIDNGPAYAAKLEKLRGNQFELLQKLTRADPGQLNVLCHCDMWTNNLLFNNTEADSTEVKLIDFQISQWASPTVDLLHSIFNSCEAQTIGEEFDEFVECYYSALKEALTILKCKRAIPSMEDFVKVMNEKTGIVAVYISETIALSRADTSLNLDLESLTDESQEAIDSRRKIFSNPEFIEAMNWILPFMDKKGFLEIE